MKLSEAEIQVLACLEKARLDETSTDRKSLEADGERFWIFQEDWSGAFSSLAARGLLSGNDENYRLTEAGKGPAAESHRQRPDLYWYYYQKFYQAAYPSAAHSELCRRAFGEDLCQEGQTDMASLNDMLDKLDLKPGDQVLDLVCGAGGIAEYVCDRTGASVIGMDASAPAIEEAARRTSAKYPRLSFQLGDMNHLELDDGSLSAMISLDTLYWSTDLEATLRDVARALKPGGQMGIFMNHHIGEGEATSGLAPECSDTFTALKNGGLAFEIYNYTTQIGEFWQRNWHAATALKGQFEAEGNGFIAASLIRESEDEYLPDVKAGRIARHLFHVLT